MSRTFFMCILSGVFGALVTIGLTRNGTQPRALAQERQPRAFSDIQPLPRILKVNDTGLEEFTPEERVNIAVYDKTNRSVVNITTHSARPNAFFFFEVPTKGSGSGSVLDKRGHILTNYHVIAGSRSRHDTLCRSRSTE